MYNGKKNGKRAVAYQSLGWNFGKCITELIKAIVSKQIIPSAIQAHNISHSDIVSENWTEIAKDISYEEITSAANLKEQLKIARSVKTNLVPLRDEKIDALINHAALITEIQVKHYCPTLLK